MKNSLRIMSVLLALVLCAGALAACGGNEAQPTAAPATAAPTTEGTEASTPFIAPPDQIGLVISADSQLITWQPYETKEDTIDFKAVDVKTLGDAGEMTLAYLEREVTFYSLVDGKLEKTAVETIIPGSVVGITTLEEGVMEVYVLSVPVEDLGTDDYEDVEDFEEVEIPPTTEAPDFGTPDSDGSNDPDAGV